MSGSEVEMSEAEEAEPQMSEEELIEALKAQMEDVEDHIDVTDVRPLMGSHSGENGEQQLAVYLKLVGLDQEGKQVEHTYAFDPPALLRISIMLSQVSIEVVDASAAVIAHKAQQAAAALPARRAAGPYL